MSRQDQARFLFNASMDVDSEHEAIFNEIYDTEHVPALLTVPGVVAIRRYRRRPVRMAIGGVIREFEFENEPKYTALYEIETPEVLLTEEWAKAVELGRWAGQVRPYTRNRRHTLHELM